MDVKKFIMKVKVLLHGFDVAVEITEDQEALRERILQKAVEAGADGAAVARLLSNEDANEVVETASTSNLVVPDTAAAGEKIAIVQKEIQYRFVEAMENMAASEATILFKDWLKVRVMNCNDVWCV